MVLIIGLVALFLVFGFTIIFGLSGLKAKSINFWPFIFGVFLIFVSGMIAGAFINQTEINNEYHKAWKIGASGDTLILIPK